MVVRPEVEQCNNEQRERVHPDKTVRTEVGRLCYEQRGTDTVRKKEGLL